MRTYREAHRYEFHCDSDDCESALVWTLACRYALSEVDAMARAKGWSIGKRHLCPEHRRGK